MTAHKQSEFEWQTRKARIDPKLVVLGWTIVRWTPGMVLTTLNFHAVTEFPTANGPADYALYVDGQLLGIIETKKLTLGPQNVLTQAERYARGAAGSFDFHGFHVPFLYSTNGEVIDPSGRSKRKETERFHKFSIAEVKAKDFKLDGFKWLKDEDIEDSDELPEPEELAPDAIAALEGAVVELNAVLAALEKTGGAEK